MMSTMNPICSNIEDLTDEMKVTESKIKELRNDKIKLQELLNDSSLVVENMKDQVCRITAETIEGKLSEDETVIELEMLSIRVKDSQLEMEKINENMLIEVNEMDSLICDFELFCLDFVERMTHLDTDKNVYEEFNQEIEKKLEEEINIIQMKLRRQEVLANTLPLQEMKLIIKNLEADM